MARALAVILLALLLMVLAGVVMKDRPGCERVSIGGIEIGDRCR